LHKIKQNNRMLLSCLWLALSAASLTSGAAFADVAAPLSKPVTPAQVAPVYPSWLIQIDQQKNLKSREMLQLALAHEAEFDTWSKEVKAKWLSELSLVYEALSRHREQMAAAERGLVITQDMESATRVELLFSMGYALEMNREVEQANEYYQKGFELAQRLEDERLIIQGLMNLSAMRSEEVDDSEALTLLKEAYDRAVRLGDKESIAQVTAQLGLQYVTISDDVEGQKLLEASYKLFDELGWAKYKITTWYNLAVTFTGQQKYEQALALFDQMLKASVQEEDPIDLYFAYLGLAQTSRQMKKLDAAVMYMEKADVYLPYLQASFYAPEHHIEKALIYRALGQTSLAFEEVSLAEEKLGAQKNISDKMISLYLQRMKSRLFADSADYEKAYKSFEQYFRGYVQLQDDKRDLQVQKLRISFDAERQTAQNELLKKDVEIQALQLQKAEHDRHMQWLWIGVFGSTTLILLGLLIRQVHRNRQQVAAASAGTAKDKTGTL